MLRLDFVSELNAARTGNTQIYKHKLSDSCFFFSFLLAAGNFIFRKQHK